MVWIKSYQSVGLHPKTKKLARLLAVPLPQVVGHLHFLWWWSFDYAEHDGCLAAYEDWQIADAAMYEGDAGAFVKALQETRYLDEVGGKLYIHDWSDHLGGLIARREYNKLAVIKSRESKKKARRKQDVGTNMVPTEEQQEANETPTKQNVGAQEEEKEKEKVFNTPPTPPRGERVRKPVDYSADFETFWQSYPRRVDKQRAWQNWKTELKSGSSAEDMIRAAKNYAKMCAAQRREVDKIKHPSTFLGRDRSWMEYVEGVPEEGISVYERSAKRSLDQIAEDFRLGLEMYDEEVIDVDARELGGILQIDGGS